MAESDNSADSNALQIGDLLTGTGGDPNSAVAYMHFTFDAVTNATVVELASEPNAPVASAKILVSGVNLTALGTHESDIIGHLLGVGSSHSGV